MSVDVADPGLWPPHGEIAASRRGVNRQGSRLKQLPIELQELARIWGAGIGDDEPDVDIVRSVGESRYESLL